MAYRPALSAVGLPPGKRARLHRMLFQHGVGNGTAIFLPYDQGLEHGPRDFEQYRRVREDAEALGIPLVVWAYPRGSAIGAKGGKDSFYAVDYAARVAGELGADVVKVNFPHPEKRTGVPPEYDRTLSTQEAVDHVVRSANRSLVLLSGGEKAGDEAMVDRARESMEAGATGLIFGRNVWQRDHDESLRFVGRLKELLAKYPSDR